MTDTDILARLLGAARTVTPVAAVSATASAVARSGAGVPVRAQVAEPLADGTFRVLIDGKALRLALPAQIKAGDVLELRVRPQASEARVEASAAQPPGRPALSAAGRLILTLLNAPAPTPLRQSRPVLDLPPARPTDLPVPLARAVERSGLFYEAHQARWIHGDYPLERLREEPQALLTRAPAPAGKEDQPAAPAAQARGSAVAYEPVRAPAEREDAPRELAARDVLPLLRQQLETLENRQIHWLGEIWPGQTMRWEIAEDAAQGQSADETRDWSTRFELCLPALGDIDAALSLSPRGLALLLTARDPASAEAMQSALPALAAALQGAGIEAVELKVRAHEPAV